MNAKNEQAANTPADYEIGDDLEITKKKRQVSAGGTWVSGSLNGHRFQALVFSEHAECADYELDDSRISKLWVQRISDKKEVVNFDRGWDVRPENTTAQAIVDFLAAGLAEFIYGNEQTPSTNDRRLSSATERKIQKICSSIAKTHLGIETLQEQKSDRCDFHELHVLAIKDALLAAYAVGRESMRKQPST